ncbi:MAG: hypothetical protein WCS92_00800 [Candidatus Babeliales bacterium]|jgi:uncharacterized membrane protein
MKIYDTFLTLIVRYLPSIMAIFIVSYFFRSIYYYDINPYAYWFFTFCIAISTSITTYKHINRPFKKPQDDKIDKKISIKDWLFLFLTAGMWLGGAYMLGYLNRLSEGYIRNILFGISLVVIVFGAQYFFEKVKTLKLIGKCKQALKFLLKALKLQKN